MVIARGNYEAYCEEIKKAESAFKEINDRLGLPGKPREEARKRLMPVKPSALAGQDKPAIESVNKPIKAPATT
jgi:hypothetical protein